MESTSEIKVWDRFIRSFHWLLVAAFFTAYLVEEERMALHVWAGYLVFSLVVLRLVWGVLGSEYARFGNFVTHPGRVVSHLKLLFTGRTPRYTGHNPAGGAMIVALLFALIATTITGMLVFGGEAGTGLLGEVAVLAGATGEAGHEAFEEAHEFFANLTVILVFIHVAGVVYESLVHRENLVRAMITGRKQA